MTKRFNQGDIVYWHRQEGNNHTVEFGIVDEQFSDAVYVDLLELKENCYINGIPLDEFQSETKYKKLPKGWSYDTKLFDMTFDDSIFDGYSRRFVNNPDDIRELYDKGLLVKASTKFHGKVEAEIDNNGYRIVKKHPMWEKPKITHTSIRPDKLYYTYQEALDEVISYNAELERQSNLTDYEWSVEEIDKVLNRCKLTEDERSKYREWLLSMDKVEDVEVRCCYGLPQWKRDKNKKWTNIEL